MFTKTLTIFYKGKKKTVLAYFDEDLGTQQKVIIRSMESEYFIIEEIIFQSRDAAYDFIKNYTPAMAKSFFIREGYSSEALH